MEGNDNDIRKDKYFQEAALHKAALEVVLYLISFGLHKY